MEVSEFRGVRPLAAMPTNSVAGSVERIEIYRQRVARGESLWHPHDNTDCLPPGRRLTLEPYKPGIRLVSLDSPVG